MCVRFSDFRSVPATYRKKEIENRKKETYDTDKIETEDYCRVSDMGIIFCLDNLYCP